jgi:hypothetical protein
MEMKLRFSARPIVLLSHLSGFLPSAVLGDFSSILARSTYHLSVADVLGLIAAAAQKFQPFRTYADLYQVQSILRTLTYHCENRELPPGTLISSLQLPEKAQVQGLEKVARVHGKPDPLNIVPCVPSQEFRLL